jgi:DNA (cytosine-5)-methyltransferase 1
MTYRLLDLFARAQGTSVGYARAGFQVTASDIGTYDRHPEIHEFITADALDVLDDVAFCRTFDAIGASPPCQGYSRSIHLPGTHGALKLIVPVREKLERIGVPYVIENVESASVRDEMKDPFRLCGTMFGLGGVSPDGVQRQLRRHRLFDSNVPIGAPSCRHTMPTVGIYGHGKTSAGRRGYGAGKEEAAQAMGIDWMVRDDLSQAVPPAFTEHIGRQLIARIAEGK